MNMWRFLRILHISVFLCVLLFAGCVTLKAEINDTEAAAAEAAEPPAEAVSIPEVAEPPAEVISSEPVLTEIEAPEPVPEPEPEPEQPSEAEEPSPLWMEKSYSLEELVLKTLVFPRTIKPVYKTSVPVIVKGTEASEGWKLSLYLWREGSRTASGIRLAADEYNFTGKIKTDFYPGENLLYSIRVEVPGDEGGICDFPGGPVTVINDGPLSYSYAEIRRAFMYQPLFDIGQAGDSPGVNRTADGLNFREVMLRGDFKRWSCRVFYRVRATGDEWRQVQSPVTINTNSNNAGRQRYNIPSAAFKPGDHVEYYFEVMILDTDQVFEIEKDHPPSFKVVFPAR